MTLQQKKRRSLLAHKSTRVLQSPVSMYCVHYYYYHTQRMVKAKDRDKIVEMSMIDKKTTSEK